MIPDLPYELGLSALVGALVGGGLGIIWGRHSRPRRRDDLYASSDSSEWSAQGVASYTMGSNHLKFLFDHAPIGMRLISADGIIRDVNPAFCELVQLQPEDLIGQPFSRYIMAEYRAQMEASFFQQLSRGRLDSDTSSYVTLWNGEMRYLHAVHRLVDVPGGPLIFSMFLDRTSEQRAAEEIERSASEMERLALTDPLTGLGNRRFFMDRLEAELIRSRRSRSPLTLLVADIDYFKSVNDRFGHQTGDQALEYFARLMRESMRASDIPARFGGEEFCLILPDTPLSGARIFAERLRTKLAHQHLMALDGTRFQMTCSIGLAEATLPNETPASLFEKSDKNVYKAKQAGRNCVVG